MLLYAQLPTVQHAKLTLRYVKAVSPAFILTLTKLVILYVEITLKQVMSNAMTITLSTEMAAMLTARMEITMVALPLLHI